MRASHSSEAVAALEAIIEHVDAAGIQVLRIGIWPEPTDLRNLMRLTRASGGSEPGLTAKAGWTRTDMLVRHSPCRCLTRRPKGDGRAEGSPGQAHQYWTKKLRISGWELFGTRCLREPHAMGLGFRFRYSSPKARSSA